MAQHIDRTGGAVKEIGQVGHFGTIEDQTVEHQALGVVPHAATDQFAQRLVGFVLGHSFFRGWFKQPGHGLQDGQLRIVEAFLW